MADIRRRSRRPPPERCSRRRSSGGVAPQAAALAPVNRPLFAEQPGAPPLPSPPAPLSLCPAAPSDSVRWQGCRCYRRCQPDRPCRPAGHRFRMGNVHWAKTKAARAPSSAGVAEPAGPTRTAARYGWAATLPNALSIAGAGRSGRLFVARRWACRSARSARRARARVTAPLLLRHRSRRSALQPEQRPPGSAPPECP